MTTDNEQTLEPCPFCPHGIGFVRNESGRYNGIVWVECDWPSHAVRLTAGADAAPPCGARTAEYQTEQEAINAWNTRVSASTAPVVDDVESSAAFVAYNQAIEDAKTAIRRVGNYDAAPEFINAIARECSPHRYVAQLPAAASPAAPASHGSTLREPVRVDASKRQDVPPPVVTRNGIPCEDQSAALEEFKEACRAVRDKSCPHWRGEGDDHCTLCGTDLGPLNEADNDHSAAPREDATRYREGFDDAARVSQVLNTVAAPTPSQPAREAAKEIVALTNWKDPQSIEVVATIIARHLPAAAETVGERAEQRYRDGVEDAAKATCVGCANTDKWGAATKIEGSTRWWHTKHDDPAWPCGAGDIRALLNDKEKKDG